MVVAVAEHVLGAEGAPAHGAQIQAPYYRRHGGRFDGAVLCWTAVIECEGALAR
jgi:hypothetical protein